MKKSRSIIYILTLFLVVVFCSCASNFDAYNKVISELRTNEFVGVAGGYKVYAVTGEREKDYKIDGVSGEKTDFLILTIEGVFSSAPLCKIAIGETEYSGQMKKHPFADSYSFEVAKKTEESTINAIITIDGEEIETTLTSVLKENSKTHEYAFSLAKQQLASTLKKHEKNGVFDGEVYIRIIPNPTKEDDRYFWYVAFYKSASECYSVLIDCEHGEILAIKDGEENTK